MKISAAIPLLDLSAPASVAAANGDAAGQGFETAVRAVAQKAGDRGGTPTGNPPPPERERAPEARKEPASTNHASSSKKEDDERKDDDASLDAAASNGQLTPTADLLGRLLAGNGQGFGAQVEKLAEDGSSELGLLSKADAEALAAVASAAGEGTTFDGALEERLVITPLGAGSAEGKSPGASKDRTGVSLEVLHMETHFEPRVDDVVLVEGAVSSGVAAGDAASDMLGGVLSTIRLGAAAGKGAEGPARAEGADEGVVPVRFDETLARLASGESASDADTSGKRGAKDGRADAKVADEARQGSRLQRNETTVEIETSVTPLAPASMTSQIADRIVDAFRSSTGQERSADTPPGTTHLRMTAGGAALKTLTIQLQPENLGKLEVSMRLVEGRLTLELAASSAETAIALAHDRAGLKKLLEHAGFSMDETAISIVARDSTAAMTRAGAAQDAGGQGQQAASGEGRSGSDASAGSERGFAGDGGGDGRGSAPRRQDRGDGQPQVATRQRSAVFL